MAARLIVNADDFGLTEAVNRGIIRAHREGIVTSASLMACGAAFEHAVELARQNPRLGIGVHLTLTQEAPVCEATSLPTLAPDGRRFPRPVLEFVRRYRAGRLDADEIGRELGAQVQRVVDTGLRVTHFDGHQHVHVLPDILAIVRELGLQYGIHAVRCPTEPMRLGSPVRMAQLWALRRFCGMADWSGLRRPDSFAGFLEGGHLDVGAALRRLPTDGITELMCHPGEADPGSDYAHWNYAWRRELDGLVDPVNRASVASRKIELVDFEAVSNTPAS